MDTAKTALLFGGSGFVGRHLSRRLVTSGWQVISVGQEPYNLISNDLPEGVVYREWCSANVKEIREYIDISEVFVHLASDIDVSKSITNPEVFISDNIKLVLDFMGLVRKSENKQPVVYVSTDRIFGGVQGVVTDNSEPSPVDPYGVSKYAGEIIIKSYSRIYDIPAVIVRPSSLYGPFQRPIQFIPSLFHKLRHSGGCIPVGDISVSRNFLYIDDFIDGLMCVLNRTCFDKLSVYNLGGNVVCLKEVCSLFKSIVESNLKVKIEYCHGEQYVRSSNSVIWEGEVLCERAIREFKWAPKVSIRDGLMEIFNKEKNNYEHLQEQY